MRRTLTALLLTLAPAAFAGTWNIDPAHSQATFNVKHMMVANVKGQFNKFAGTVEIDDKDITKSKVDVKIDAASIDTNEPKRDAHLMSPDFFDVQKCPELTFKSNKVEKAGEGKLKVTGDLTMHCVTKPVTLDVEGPSAEMKGPWGNTLRAAHASTTLNRKDFGLTWNKALEKGGLLVGDEVKIELDLELTPAPAQPKVQPAKAEKK